jgi:GT2 family glycosyltransferase
MTSSLVSIGIVSWNSESHLPTCFNALKEQNYPNLEIIIVDNASTDNSLSIISRFIPEAKVICNQSNTGFCHAHNQAIELSRGEYYLALNPDVTLQPEYVRTLVFALEEKKGYGLAGGKLLLSIDKDQHRIDSTGLFIDRRRRQLIRGHGEHDIGQYDLDEEVFGLDGAAPLYRKAMLEDIKIFGEYFDENFFMHKEDVDISWRARLLGWRCWYAHNAIAYHKRTFRPGIRGAINSDIKVHAVKNRYLLMLKNESKEGWNRDKYQILWYDVKILSYICLVEPSSLSAFGLIRRTWDRTIKWRNEIKVRSRAEPGQILQWFN